MTRSEYIEKMIAVVRASDNKIDITNRVVALADRYFGVSQDLDQPWPLMDVIKKLCEATDILLHKKDYDGHEWEEMEICLKRGLEIIKDTKQ